MRSSAAPVTVSPGRGRRSTLATRSRLTEPTTVSSGLCRKRAEVERGPREVLAQVEEAGPEGGAVGSGADAGHVREPLQSADEHGELQIRLRDARRAGRDPGALQDGRPLDQLARARAAVPGAAFGPAGLELEQIAVERMFQPCQRGLGPVGRMA